MLVELSRRKDIFMFNKLNLTVKTLSSIIYALYVAEHGVEECKKADLKRFSRGVATAMLGAKNTKQFDEVYDQIGITLLHVKGVAAIEKHVRELLREAKKRF